MNSKKICEYLQTDSLKEFTKQCHCLMPSLDIKTVKVNLINLNVAQDKNENLNASLQVLSETFPVLFQRLQELKGDDPKQRTLINDALTIWFVKASKYPSKKFSGLEDNPVSIYGTLEKLDCYTFIFQYTIDFWIEGNSALSNSTRSLFIKMCTFIEKFEDLNGLLFKKWLQQCLYDINKKMKVRYFLFDTLFSFMSTTQAELVIFEDNHSNFITELLELMSSNALALPAGKTLSNFIIRLYKEKCEEKINQHWINQTIECLKKSEPSTVKNMELYLLSPIFKKVPKSVFKTFVSRLKNDISTMLSILKVGQELGIIDEPFHPGEYHLISLDVVVNELLQSSLYKNSAFQLLTYNCKSSQPLQGYLYEIILSNITVFFVDYDVWSRNYFESLFKQFLYRIKDSTYGLNRTVQKLRAKNKFLEEQIAKAKDIVQAQSFILKLMGVVKFQLIPGSQYQRILVALKVLKILLESGLDSRIEKKFYDKKQATTSWCFNVDLVDESLIKLLLNTLTNSFTDVQILSTNLLIMISSSEDLSNLAARHIDTLCLFQTGLQMLKSYNSTVSGSRVISFVVSSLLNSNKISMLHDCICQILVELENSIQISNEDYLKGLDYPVDGYFLSLSSIMENDSSAFETDTISKMVEAVKNNWVSTKGILCHDSSEGSMPLEYLNTGISDQIITSYAYRSVKEASALLETLLLSQKVLTTDQLAEVGSLLMEQLNLTRHSGAFQAVAPSFSACCAAISNTNNNKLSCWLDEILQSMQNKAQHITRRSGGLPFLVTAILSSEPLKNERPLLHYTFRELLSIAQVPILKHEEKLDLPQVHALNSMKAIFEEPKLNDASSKYVYEALILCLNNFQSSLWSMRNCAIMLFTALQNKLFGKFGKTTSARSFFTKYKGIRESLLEHLSNAVDSETGSSVEILFLVLTIISKLKQTPGYDGLDAFVPLVVQCLESATWKVRELAARAMPGIVQDTTEMSKYLLKTLTTKPLSSQNRLHGYLYAINEMKACGVTFDSSTKDSVYSLFHTCVFSNPCYSSANEYVNLISALNLQDDSTFFNNLRWFFVERYGDETMYGSKQLLLKNIAELLLKYEDPANIEDLLMCILGSTSFEVQLSGLDFIIENQKSYVSVTSMLYEMLNNDSTWMYVKSKILLALQACGKSIPSTALLKLLESETESDDVKLSALQSFSSFTDSEECGKYWNLITEYSSDAMDLPYRKAALCSLINLPVSSQSLLPLSLFLNDDDYDLRAVATEFISSKYLKDNTSDIPKTVFSRFFEKYNENNARETTEYLINDLKQMQVDLVANSKDSDQLFALEQPNMVKNVPEMIFAISRKLDVTSTENYPMFEKELKKNVLKLVDQLAHLEKQDQLIAWCSSAELFNQTATLLILSKRFDALSFKKLTDALGTASCQYVLDSLSFVL